MFFNIPSQWAPLAMIGISVIMSNGSLEPAKIQVSGLLAAHLYDFLTRLWPEFGGGWSMIKTPQFVRRMFASDIAGVAGRSYGTAFTPADRGAQGSSTGASAGGVLPEAWRSRGSGHRLGGE